MVKYTGQVKSNVFFDILALMKIKLKEVDEKALALKHGQAVSGKINYKSALAALTINLESQNPFEDYWVFRNHPL